MFLLRTYKDKHVAYKPFCWYRRILRLKPMNITNDDLEDIKADSLHILAQFDLKKFQAAAAAKKRRKELSKHIGLPTKPNRSNKKNSKTKNKNDSSNHEPSESIHSIHDDDKSDVERKEQLGHGTEDDEFYNISSNTPRKKSLKPEKFDESEASLGAVAEAHSSSVTDTQNISLDITSTNEAINKASLTNIQDEKVILEQQMVSTSERQVTESVAEDVRFEITKAKKSKQPRPKGVALSSTSRVQTDHNKVFKSSHSPQKKSRKAKRASKRSIMEEIRETVDYPNEFFLEDYDNVGTSSNSQTMTTNSSTTDTSNQTTSSFEINLSDSLINPKNKSRFVSNTSSDGEGTAISFINSALESINEHIDSGIQNNSIYNKTKPPTPKQLDLVPIKKEAKKQLEDDDDNEEMVYIDNSDIYIVSRVDQMMNNSKPYNGVLKSSNSLVATEPSVDTKSSLLNSLKDSGNANDDLLHLNSSNSNFQDDINLSDNDDVVFVKQERIF